MGGVLRILPPYRYRRPRPRATLVAAATTPLSSSSSTIQVVTARAELLSASHLVELLLLLAEHLERRRVLLAKLAHLHSIFTAVRDDSGCSQAVVGVYFDA